MSPAIEPTLTTLESRSFDALMRIAVPAPSAPAWIVPTLKICAPSVLSAAPVISTAVEPAPVRIVPLLTR